NRSGEVLHAVEAGEAYEVTSRGKPVARLVPITEAKSDLALHRPAATHGGFSQMIRHSIAIPSSESNDDLRESGEPLLPGYLSSSKATGRGGREHFAGGLGRRCGAQLGRHPPAR